MINIATDPSVVDMVEYHYKNKEYLLAEMMISLDEKFADDLCNELQMQLMLKNVKYEQEETLDGLN